MTKTIIIPTDFTIESLEVLKETLDQNTKENYNLILLHGVDVGNSITELLTFNKHKLLRKLSNTDFEDACAIIKNKFESKITSFRVDIFTGYNQAAFDNYLEANNVEEALIPEEELVKTSKNSFDLVKFILGSKILRKENASEQQESVFQGNRGFAKIFSH